MTMASILCCFLLKSHFLQSAFCAAIVDHMEDRYDSCAARSVRKFGRGSLCWSNKGMSKARKTNSGDAGPQTDSKRGGLQRGQTQEPGQDEGTTLKGVRISRRAADRLRAGHLWVYASEVEAVAAAGLLPVADNRGILLGTGLYSPASQIALRMVSRQAIEEAGWLELLASRLQKAIARRRPMLDAETDSCRLVFSEADELPGIVIDKYADVVVLQLLSKALDSAAVRERCAAVLRQELSGSVAGLTVWERADPRIRELEGLSASGAAPLFAADPERPVGAAEFRLNGLRFQFDVSAGQKTGAFLDQRQNYAAAERWGRELGVKRALDVCTYQGGFALHLARVCDRVTGVDASRASLEVAERNLQRNRESGEIAATEVEWIEADAFDLLRDWAAASNSERWDAIVLDPPAFAKSKRAVEGALRGYKELNLRALRLIAPGGLLVTCSCSHHVGWQDLTSVVASAAADAGRRVTVLERRGAALDHPVVLTLPETEYLKCLICLVD